MKRIWYFILLLLIAGACTHKEDIVPVSEDPVQEEPKDDDKGKDEGGENEDGNEEGQETTDPVPDPPSDGIVQIPDAAFKTYLLANFDADADGEISATEAESVTSITVSTDNIGSLEGIRYFKNLVSLTANGYRDQDRNIMGLLTGELDLSGLKKLETLECRHNHIERIKFGKNDSLKRIICYGNSLVELDLKEAPALDSVDAGDCSIIAVDVSECHLLTTLYVHNNRIVMLDLRYNPLLQHLTCDRNPLIKILLAAGHVISDMRMPDDTQIEYDGNAVPTATLGTGLKSVFINYTGSISKSRWTENGTISIVDDEGRIYYMSDSLAIQGRGNSTWSYPKKPYKIKLKEKADLLGHGKSKRYVLLANWMDRTLLRNDVSFELARKTSIPWTPSGEFVELYLNGAHMGNYWLGEQIRVEKNRVAADYMIEMDTYYDETWKFYSTYGYKPNTNDSGLPIGVKYPDDDDLTQTQFQEVKNLVASTEKAIYFGDYNTGINVDSFIDWYLVHEITGNMEPNHPKSCYFHFKGGVMIAGPVWDFDWYTFQPSLYGLSISSSIYYKELLKKPGFVARLKERWTELKPEFAAVDSYIVSQAELIRKSDAINNAKWPCTSYVNGDDTMTFDDAVYRMRTALAHRIREVDSAIGKL